MVSAFRVIAFPAHEEEAEIEPWTRGDYTALPFPKVWVDSQFVCRRRVSPQGMMISMQRTLIIFKPDCVQRRLVGKILQRFETKGLRVAALRLLQVSRELGEQHYGEHKGKPFFPKV